MATTERLKMEESNSNNIFLVREGIIWYACERSAYRLMKYLPNLHPVKRLIKENREVTGNDACFIRFPSNRLDYMLKQIRSETPLLIKEQTKDKITIVVDKLESDEQAAFSEWRKNIAIPPPKIRIRKPKPGNEIQAAVEAVNPPDVKDINDYILRKIKDYPVFNKTPLETMQFVAEIQELLK